MNIVEIQLDNYPKTIIEAVISSSKDSYINIDKIKSNKYIIKVKNQKYGIFNWDEIFSKEKIIDRSNDFLLLKIYIQNSTLNCTYEDSNGIILKSENLSFSKSKYLYFLNNSYNFNKKIINLNFDKIDKYFENYIENFNKIIDFNFIISYKPDLLILEINNYLLKLPFQLISNYFATNKILSLFSVNPEKQDRLNSIKIILNENIKISDILFLKEAEFEIEEKLWSSLRINKIIFEDSQQFLNCLQQSKIITLFAHGYRKKDFSSIKIGKYFFNPFSLIDCQPNVQVLLLLSCMIDYYKSENNLLYNLFKKDIKLILSSPFILPLEYVENIFNIIINKNYNNLYELLLSILSSSVYTASLLRIFI
ncbi:MAG: hypothetical protein ACK4YF_00810 [Exilispira sp.]